MQVKTRGIVLNFIKYQETSIIARIYTETYGALSFIVNGVRSHKKPGKSNKNTIAFFQPLTLLDLVIYYKPGRNLNRISEMKCTYPYRSLPYDHKKSTIAFFLSEILNKCLKESDSHEALFNFLYNAFTYLDQAEEGFNDFHLLFLLKFMRFLGFDPGSGEEINDQLGRWFHNELLDEQEITIINHLLNYQISAQPAIPLSSKRHILQVLLDYYRLHIDNFGEIKSHKILQQILIP